MRKVFFLSILVLSCTTLMGQSNLPNGNFEDWVWESHPTHHAGGFFEPGGGFFKTLNILDTIPTPSGLTCYPTDTAHTGEKGVRLITQKISMGPVEIIIPGVVGNLQIRWTTMNAALGLPYPWTTKPSRFQGYYMSFPLNGDSTAAILLLSKWNASAGRRDTVAYNRLVFKEVSTSYTLFDVAVDYWNETTMPDSITVLLLSCAGYNASMMTASVGQVGSQACFDDVTLTDVSGFPYLLMPEVQVRLFPNPARDIMRIALSENVKEATFGIYNLTGQLIREQTICGQEGQVGVSGMPAGNYLYKLTRGNNVLNTGSFQVIR